MAFSQTHKAEFVLLGVLCKCYYQQPEEETSNRAQQRNGTLKNASLSYGGKNETEGMGEVYLRSRVHFGGNRLLCLSQTIQL